MKVAKDSDINTLCSKAADRIASFETLASEMGVARSETLSDIGRRTTEVAARLVEVGQSEAEAAVAIKIEFKRKELSEEWLSYVDSTGDTIEISEWAEQRIIEVPPAEETPEDTEVRVRALGRWARMSYPHGHPVLAPPALTKVQLPSDRYSSGVDWD